MTIFINGSERFCAILVVGQPRDIFKCIHWLRQRSCLKVCSISSSGGHFVQRMDDLSNFGRGLTKEHPCQIILICPPFSRRKHLKFFFLFIALAAILFNRAKLFELF